MVKLLKEMYSSILHSATCRSGRKSGRNPEGRRTRSCNVGPTTHHIRASDAEKVSIVRGERLKVANLLGIRKESGRNPEGNIGRDALWVTRVVKGFSKTVI